MSAYNKGFDDINTLLDILSKQAQKVDEYNKTANSALDKELRDIFIGYRNDEIKVLSNTLDLLKERMPEFKTKTDKKNKNDIGIGDLK